MNEFISNKNKLDICNPYKNIVNKSFIYTKVLLIT